MPPADLIAWERAGPMLAARRVQISPRYASRRAFAADTGMNWRTLYDAERAKRANFKAETLGAFESAYQLVPGSLERTLAGGALEAVPPGDALPPLPPEPPTAADEALLLFPDDKLKQAIWRQPNMTADERAELIATVEEKRAEQRQRRGGEARTG